MPRVTGALLVVVALGAPAPARPPFPQEVELRLACERAHVAATPFESDVTTCVASALLSRAGPARLVLEVAGADREERLAGEDGAVVTHTTGAAAATIGLDVNLGRERGDLGVELLLRMSVVWGLGAERTRAEPYPLSYGGVRVGVGWRWLELGGSPWPRPGDPRVLHLGFGLDAHHWVGVLGLGLFSLMAFDEANDALERRPTAFAAYADVVGRLGDLRVGARAILGAWQGLQLLVGWRFDAL